MSKYRYVNGLQGFQINKVLEFTIGEPAMRFVWNDQTGEYNYFIRDHFLKDEKVKKSLDYFQKFWMVRILPLSEMV